MEFSTILNQIINKKNLNIQEASSVMKNIMEGKYNDSQMASILVSLKMKGETTTEIASFANVMRENALDMSVNGHEFIDTCGTGGDQSNTYNVSTIAAIIACGAGVKVAKHGNRSVSSKSGSADVLEALGIDLEMSPSQSRVILEKLGISFLYAPKMHLAMKNIMPVRRSLGIPTFFNMLGPITNPARVNKQIIGVSNPDWVEFYAKVLKEMGHKEAYIVHGHSGLDEVSITGDSKVAHLNNGIIEMKIIKLKDFSITPNTLKSIEGGSPKENAQIILSVLNGDEKGPKREIACINAALAISLGLQISDLNKAYEFANHAVDSGAAIQVLEKWKNFSEF